MPRSPQQNQRLKDERREQIMRAGLTIFARKGLAASKISDIAAACDLSYGLVYHYFHDKEELYLALVERALRGTLRLTTQAVEESGAAWDRLRWLVAQMVEGTRDAPEYFLIILQAQVTEQPPSAIHTLFTRFSQQIWTNVTTLIRQAQADGQVVAMDAGELAFALAATIQGLAMSQAFPLLGTFPQVETVLRFLRPTIDQAPGPPHAD